MRPKTCWGALSDLLKVSFLQLLVVVYSFTDSLVKATEIKQFRRLSAGTIQVHETCMLCMYVSYFCFSFISVVRTAVVTVIVCVYDLCGFILRIIGYVQGRLHHINLGANAPS